MIKHLVIDIETWPRSHEDLAKYIKDPLPFEPWGPFDPNAVKLGNAKRPDTVAKKIKEAKENWPQMEQEAREKWEFEQTDGQIDGLMEKACLKSPLSRVFGVGYKTGPYPTDGLLDFCLNPDGGRERSLVTRAWDKIREVVWSGGKVITFNGTGFDLPFLEQRARALGIPIAVELPPVWWQCDWHIDLMKLWTRSNDYVSLDHVAKALGFEGKVRTEGKLPWEIANEDEHVFKSYFERDLEQTWKVAEVLVGIVPDEEENATKDMFAAMDGKQEMPLFDGGEEE